LLVHRYNGIYAGVWDGTIHGIMMDRNLIRCSDVKEPGEMAGRVTRIIAKDYNTKLSDLGRHYYKLLMMKYGDLVWILNAYRMEISGTIDTHYAATSRARRLL